MMSQACTPPGSFAHRVQRWGTTAKACSVIKACRGFVVAAACKNESLEDRQEKKKLALKLIAEGKCISGIINGPCIVRNVRSSLRELATRRLIVQTVSTSQVTMNACTISPLFLISNLQYSTVPPHPNSNQQSSSSSYNLPHEIINSGAGLAIPG